MQNAVVYLTHTRRTTPAKADADAALFSMEPRDYFLPRIILSRAVGFHQYSDITNNAQARTYNAAQVIGLPRVTSTLEIQENDKLLRREKWRINTASRHRSASLARNSKCLNFSWARIVYLRMADAAGSLIGKKIAKHAAPINLISIGS